METAEREIGFLIDRIEKDCLADDGGLTWAASNYLDDAHTLIQWIREGQIKKILEAEGEYWSLPEALDITQDWAMRKLRRRVEDRLRKLSERAFGELLSIAELLGVRTN